MADGPEILGSAAPAGNKVTVDSHVKTTVVVEKIPVNILEMEDVLFHHNSAVIMPEVPETESGKEDADASEKQKKVSGLKAMALLFQFLEVNPDKRLLLAGHTDSSGGVTINFELSGMRAQNVMCVLDGSRDGWVKVAFGRHKVEDYQQILMYVYKNKKWPCNPTKVDDRWGPNTKSATEAFINYYNTEFVAKFKNEYAGVFEIKRLSTGEAGLVDKDGKHRWTEALWEAAFNIYDKTIADALKLTPKDLKERRAELIKYVDDMNRYVACGESFPIDQAHKDDYRSKSNRRVEIIALDEKHAAKIKIACPRKEDGTLKWSAKHKEEECPLWHKLLLSPAYIDPSDLHSVLYHMKFRYYNIVKKSFVDVPEGIEIEAYENDADKLETVTYFSGGVYSVKVRFKTALDDGSHDKLRFEFKTKDKWIYTKDNGSTPKIVTMDPAKPKEKVTGLLLEERLKYYDLPQRWSSKNYWVCYDGNLNAGERYDEKKLRPTSGGKITKSDKPMIFSLDDIVLIDSAGRQNINAVGNVAPKDKDGNDARVDLSDKSRYSMFYVKDEELVLYNPENADAPYFTNDPFKENLITKLPADGQVRLIAFANDFYGVFEKRTTADANFKPDSMHVVGARAALARIKGKYIDKGIEKDIDKDAVWERFNGAANVPAGHGSLFFANPQANYEVYYIHNGCVLSKPADNGGCKIRSFLVIYWNGVFISHTYAAPGAANQKLDAVAITAAHVESFAVQGLMNAKKRWEKKGYLIEPVNTPKKDTDCAIQIKPFFFFEAKKNNLGGKPKCTVKISNDEKTGWMGVATSEMYRVDYAINDYLRVGSYLDIDGIGFETLVVAHELGHAEGKHDEYAYKYDGIKAPYQDPADGGFTQYYPGMPYQVDMGSMMRTNRAPRMRHLWGFTNWLNEASKNEKKLKPFLDGSQFQIVHRFVGKDSKTRELKYHLGFKKSDPVEAGDYDFRNFIKPVKSESVSTGTINTTLSLYKMGGDEFARIIPDKSSPLVPVFDAILPVSIKIGASFTDGGVAPNKWDDVKKENWIRNLRQTILDLNALYYLQNKNNGHQFKNTYICFFPIIGEGAPAAVSDLDLTVHLDGKTTIYTKSGKTLKVGNLVHPLWIVKYILGQDDGAVIAFFKKLFGAEEWIGKEYLDFIEKWHEKVMDGLNMDSDFELKERWE